MLSKLIELPPKLLHIMTDLLMIGPWQLIIIGLTLLGFVFTLVALIDILKSDFKGNNKMVWVLVVLFGSLLGVILYFVIGKNQKVGFNDNNPSLNQ